MLQQIENDLKNALKNQDKIKAGVLRLLISKCKNKSIATGSPLNDSDVMKVLQTAAKQHKESIKLYKEGDRIDLVDQETAELSIVEELSKRIQTVKSKVDEMTEERKKANALEDAADQAKAYCENVVPYFELLRYEVDKLEALVDNNDWPLPKYREMLFTK